MAAINTIALDLEGTLISNAVSVFSRPGLYDFLTFCRQRFDRVVIYTCVKESRVRAIMEILVEEGSVPRWFSSVDVYVCNRGQQKDLRTIGDPTRILLLDDQKAYIVPAQESQWVPVHEYEPPFTQDDQEMRRLKKMLGEMLDGQSWLSEGA